MGALPAYLSEVYLLELAAEVEGLRGPAFDSAVRTMRYRDFVARSEKAFERAASGTPPTAVVNGNRVREAYSGVLHEEVAFGRLLDAVEDPDGWEEYGPMSEDLD